MSEVLILEFRDVSPDLYETANKALELDPDTGTGQWPAGIVSHVAGAHADGNGLTVVEVWESREAQDEFMNTRLGPVLGQVGIPQPTRAEWMAVKGYHVT